MNTKMLRGYLYAILSAVIYGCMPLMAKYIYADGVTPLTLAFLRNLLALPALAALAYRSSRTFRFPVRMLPSLSLLAVLGCSVTPMLLFSSYQFIASGTATVFHFIYPAVVILSGMVFLKKKAQAGNIVSVLMCVTGVCLFYTPGQPLNATGSILALSSGVTFAIYVMMLAAFPHDQLSGFLFTFYVAALSSAATFIACAATGSLALPSTLTGWALCALFALLVSAGAVVLFQQSAFMIGSERTSILSTLEPVTSLLVGVILFREPFGPRVLTGSLLVIAASVLIAVLDLKRNRTSSAR